MCPVKLGQWASEKCASGHRVEVTVPIVDFWQAQPQTSLDSLVEWGAFTGGLYRVVPSRVERGHEITKDATPRTGGWRQSKGKNKIWALDSVEGKVAKRQNIPLHRVPLVRSSIRSEKDLGQSCLPHTTGFRNDVVDSQAGLSAYSIPGLYLLLLVSNS